MTPLGFGSLDFVGIWRLGFWISAYVPDLPPFVVLRMIPPAPTAHPVCGSTNRIPMREGAPEVPRWRTQDAPPSVVAPIWPFSPTNQPLVPLTNETSSRVPPKEPGGGSCCVHVKPSVVWRMPSTRPTAHPVVALTKVIPR